jgi:hypothetical protein
MMGPKRVPTYGGGRKNLGAYLKVVLLVIAVVALTLAVLWSCFVGGTFLLFYRS